MSAAKPESISVVVPAYRAESYVGRAVASALRQTLVPLEVIVVDDGSDDATAAVAAAAGARVVRQTNAGVGAARNSGVRAARGAWIAFLDADDLWHPEKLIRQARALALRPDVRLIATDYAISRGGEPEPGSVLATHRAFRLTPSAALDRDVAFLRRDDAARWLPAGQFLCPSSVVVARDLALAQPFATASELPSDRLVHVSEDLEWYLRVLRDTDLIVVTQPLVNYLVHAGSLSANAGRITYGDVALGALVAARPGAYHPAAAAAFRRSRRAKQREAALQFTLSQQPAAARTVLSAMLAERYDVRDAALLVLGKVLDRAAMRWLQDRSRASGLTRVARRLLPRR